MPPPDDPSVIRPSAPTAAPSVAEEPVVGDSDPTPLLGVAPVQISPQPGPAPAPAPPTRPIGAPSLLAETAETSAVGPTEPRSVAPVAAEPESSAPDEVAGGAAPSPAAEPPQTLSAKSEEKPEPVASPSTQVSGAADTAPVAVMGVPQRRRGRVLFAAAAAFLLGLAAGAALMLHFQPGFLKRLPGTSKVLVELYKEAEKLEANGLKEPALWKYEEVLRLAAANAQGAPAIRDLANKAKEERERLRIEVMTAKGFVLLAGEWVPRERAELEQTRTERDALKAERDTLKAERDALKAQLGTTQVPTGRVRVSVSVRAGRFGMPWPDAGALAILIPKGEPGKLPALATLRDRNKLRENQQAASEKGAHVGFAGRDGRLTFEGIKSGGYNLIISGNVPDDPTNARTNRERLARFFDAAGLANQVHIADVDVAPGEQKDVSHQFSVLRRP